ncbi:DUF72 domain-containing protein [Dyadobacter sandarakinus]|uniref:DUF72 domain-containing protein n=1 Tax=Dyadobacter sandarakinus TaxID=2747268 RepID=A0ABX7I2T0_9BACT|nr:DUF72 domain-containing protein [Dyadobacter sandarakinus]QRQ99856.1 DUF72 domain-containing protein [Dyadobacter sandarakinus]
MQETASQNFYAGTSGLVLPVPNKQFYPEEFKNKSRLTYYASMFNSIEINSSFYKIPLASTVRNWATQVPDNFRFTFKLWRDITHQKGLIFNPDDVLRFMDVINQIGPKKGCLLVQFPPSLKAIMQPRLEVLLQTLAEGDPRKEWNMALEFRHDSWYTDATYELLDHFGAGIVLHDKPGSAPEMPDEWTRFRYLRFHGPKGDYRGQYEDDFLYEFAERIREWTQEDLTVYAYFNNTMGEAMKNLNLLNAAVSSGEEDPV